jgi:hypothetical protein
MYNYGILIIKSDNINTPQYKSWVEWLLRQITHQRMDS